MLQVYSFLQIYEKVIIGVQLPDIIIAFQKRGVLLQ